jgi:hypothetical protein
MAGRLTLASAPPRVVPQNRRPVPVLSTTATITYTGQEVYTIPNMTGSVSANTGSSVTFNVPGGVQYSSWGNPEYFYFNFGDGSASGWVSSSASHT